jgi:tetratricopeptide (TPR) repeat protein
MKLQPVTNGLHYTEAVTRFARGLGAARSGDSASAQAEAGHLARLRDALKGKDEYWATEIDVSRLGVSAWTALALGDKEEALNLMRRAAEMEDKNEKHIVTPGRILPARELLGQMLLELKRPGEALKEFEASQVREPNRLHGFAGAARAAAESGNSAKANQYYSKLIELTRKGQSRPEIEQAKVFLAQP